MKYFRMILPYQESVLSSYSKLLHQFTLSKPEAWGQWEGPEVYFPLHYPHCHCIRCLCDSVMPKAGSKTQDKHSHYEEFNQLL